MRDKVRLSDAVVGLLLNVKCQRGDPDCVRDVFRGARGDTVLVLPGRWVILVNLPFQRLVDALQSLSGRLTVKSWKWSYTAVRAYEDRHFELAKLQSAEIEIEYLREKTTTSILEEKEKFTVGGVELTVVEANKRTVQETGVITLLLDESGVRVRDKLERSVPVSEKRERHVVWRVVDESQKFARIVKRISGSKEFSNVLVTAGDRVVLVSRMLTVWADTLSVSMPGEQQLLQCSNYYTISVPSLIWESPRGYYAEFTVYYRGRKRRVVWSSARQPSPRLFFRFERQRSVSTYARRVLPKGFPGEEPTLAASFLKGTLEEFEKAAREACSAARKLRSKPKPVSPVEELTELFYSKTPKRKLAHLSRYMSLFETVKDLAPNATLYVVFHGRGANYAGFRVDKDGSMTVLASRQLPLSGIVMSGGGFERAYREAMKLDRLVSWLYSPTARKLEMIKRDVEEARALIGDAVNAKLSDTIEALSSQDPSDNIVLSFFHYAKNVNRGEWRGGWDQKVSLAESMLASIVRTGRGVEKIRERGVLDTIRAAVLWELKNRGYSPRKGVMFMGDPDTVKARILETVKRLRGRLLALAMEEEESVEEQAAATRLTRLEALLEELG